MPHRPVVFVKIDGPFIRTLDHSEDGRLFVKALFEAVHGYGKLAIAEFVDRSHSSVGGGAWVDYAQPGLPLRPAESVLALKPG